MIISNDLSGLMELVKQGVDAGAGTFEDRVCSVAIVSYLESEELQGEDAKGTFTVPVPLGNAAIPKQTVHVTVNTADIRDAVEVLTKIAGALT